MRGDDAQPKVTWVFTHTAVAYDSIRTGNPCAI